MRHRFRWLTPLIATSILLNLTASGLCLIVQALQSSHRSDSSSDKQSASPADVYWNFSGQRSWYQKGHPVRWDDITISISGSPPNFQLAVTHNLKLSSQDPLFTQTTQGEFADSISLFTREMLGELVVISRRVDLISYSPPTWASRSDGNSTIIIKGQYSSGAATTENLESTENPGPDVYGISITPPEPPLEGMSTGMVSPLSGSSISIISTGWRLAGIKNATASPIDPHRFQVSMPSQGNEIRAAFVPENGFVGDDVACVLQQQEECVQADDQDDDGEGMLDRSVILFPLSITAPWLALLILIPKISRRSRLRFAIAALIGYMLIVGALAVSPWAETITGATALALLTGAPAGVAIWLLRQSLVSRPTRTDWISLSSFVLALAVLVAACAFTIFYTIGASLGSGLNLTAGIALLAAISAGISLVYRRALIVNFVATISISAIIGFPAIIFFPPWLSSNASFGIALEWLIGASWSLVAAAAIGRFLRPVNPVWLILVLAGGVLLWSKPALYTDDSIPSERIFLSEPFSLSWLAQLGGKGLLLGLMTAMILILLRFGGHNTAVKDPITRLAAIVLIMATIAGRGISLAAPVAVIAAGIGIACLLPTRTSRRAVTLSAISQSVHARLIRQELRRRTLAKREASVFRTELRTLSPHDDDSDALRKSKEDESPRGRTRFDRDFAFASSGGYTPWDNARASFWIGLVLGLPLVAWEVSEYRDFVFVMTWFNIIDIARGLGRWAIYALVFGFFYTRIPGVTPLRKSMRLIAAIFPAELLTALDSEVSDSRLGMEVALRFVGVLAYCVMLGLFWERRLLEAAGINWSSLRDVRRIRSLAAPLGAAAIAVVTAVATSLVGIILNEGSDKTPPPGIGTQVPSSQSPSGSRPG